MSVLLRMIREGVGRALGCLAPFILSSREEDGHGIGLDVHRDSCMVAEVGLSGKRLKSFVVETNGSALVEAFPHLNLLSRAHFQ